VELQTSSRKDEPFCSN